jgi:hypothetical protein
MLLQTEQMMLTLIKKWILNLILSKELRKYIWTLEVEAYSNYRETTGYDCAESKESLEIEKEINLFFKPKKRIKKHEKNIKINA